MTLTELFKDIADAIREKKGTTAPIVAEDFPEEIESIESGGDNNAFIGKNITSYLGTSNSSLLNVLIEKVDFSNMDFSNATNMQYMFSYCRGIKEIDLSKVKLPSNITGTNYMFRYCTNLESINFGNMNMTNVIVMNGMFIYCPSLSDDTLNNILKLCVGAVTMSNKTLSNLGLTQAQATRCTTLSNYQEFLDAGWTTGY